MKATSASLLTVMKGPKQFVIPIYQRTYSWQLSQCQQLLSDIIKTGASSTGGGHFLGSLVYFQENIYNTSDVPQLLIIDGQQRVTSISLLLLAISNFIENNSVEIDTNPQKIKNYYLLNAEEDGELRLKLLLTKRDKTTFASLVNNTPLPEKYSQRIFENYSFFLSALTKETIGEIYKGINRLFVVDVTLEKEKDNPQLIFESMNSTGLDLSQADLIRNYVLMGQQIKDQNLLYEKYWLPMEQNYGNEYNAHFDRFMRDFLSLKIEIIPNIDKVYQVFKGYSVDRSIEEIVSEITKYSYYYANMVLQKEKDEKLSKAFKNLSILKIDVAYPFLLQVYNDYVDDTIDRETFLYVLKLIENYVFRRAISGIPTNSLNKTFLTLHRSINKEVYKESLAATMQLFTGYKRYPNDSEFMKELQIKDLYNFRSKGYFLYHLENYKRKELVNINEYSVEHILPQNENLRPEWKTMLGPNYKEIQQSYLHTLGNLTLTGYNSELSDRPFQIKKTIKGGFNDSPLNLNAFLRKTDFWNEETIKMRALELSKICSTIWFNPNLTNEKLAPYLEIEKKKNTQYSLEDYSHLKGEILSLYQLLRKAILLLDEAVKEEHKKLYIAFKTSTNFVDVVPQKARLRLSLNLPFDEIVDPKGLCKNVTDLGRWGNGDVEVGINNIEDLEYVMTLVEQALDYQDK